MLLKITHWPYVAVIWAYESIDEYLTNSRGMREHSVSSLGGPSSRSAKKQQGRVSTPRAVAASLSQASLEGAGNAATGLPSRPMARPLSMGQDDVRTMLMKLTSQVEHLTAVVADPHQEQPHDEADAA